jgi:hypothetical protein
MSQGIPMKEKEKQKPMINQDMTVKHSKDLHFKKDQILAGIKVFFMGIVILVTIMDIRLYIAELMEGTIKQRIEVLI